MGDVLTYTLMGGSALMFAAAAGFLGFGVYQNFFERFGLTARLIVVHRSLA